MPQIGPNEFRVVVYGERLVARHFDELGERAIEARPAMEEIYLTILDIEDEIFDKQGARGGDAEWEAVFPAWLARKLKKYGEARTLHMLKRLRASVTQYRHPEQYARLERSKVVFGSRVPYARVHQFGREVAIAPSNLFPQGTTGGTPQRKYVKFTESDQNAFAREVLRHCMRAFA